MDSTRGEREWRRFQNINSQSGNNDSEGYEREWLPVINTDRDELEQFCADIVRARRRARCWRRNATREIVKDVARACVMRIWL